MVELSSSKLMKINMPYNFDQFSDKASKSIEHLKLELKKLRTGRAHAQLLDDVKVEAYSTVLNIQEVATINVPDANMIVIKPYDKNLLDSIEKAISNSHLNISPVIGGDTIKIIIPPLTAERRQEMVKLLSQKLEQAKVILRSVRTDAKKEIEAQADQAGISEDDVKRDLTELDAEIKKFMETLEKLAESKKQELLAI